MKGKIPIKIVISGNRACGKSVMAQHLTDMFRALGAEVKHIDPDIEKPNYGKEEQQYYRSIEKQFYKQRITIEVKDVSIKDYESYEKQFKIANKYLKKWHE